MKNEKTKGGEAFLLELITSTFLTYSLSVLSFESRFFLGETMQHVSSSCSHVYKVHICVHNVQYTLSSNLLLWLLLVKYMFPFSEFWPRFIPHLDLPPLVLISRRCVQELNKKKRKKGKVTLVISLSYILKGLWTFYETRFYYSHCNVVTLILLICFVSFFFKWACCFNCLETQ